MGEPKGEGRTVQQEYDWDVVEPAVAVLESIAVFEHGDESEAVSVLDEPLSTHVETDALNTLVRSGTTTSVTFTVAEYSVRIHRNVVGVARAER